jgi:hypothetical protein
MKNPIFALLILIVLASACQESSKSDKTTNEANAVLEDGIVVYNFHMTIRCISCIAIEEATIKTLNTYFAEELKSGKIKQLTLNLEETDNSKFAEKYEVVGSGLMITSIKNGKETTIDLTAEGFKYAENQEDKFVEIVKTHIGNLLKE